MSAAPHHRLAATRPSARPAEVIDIAPRRAVASGLEAALGAPLALAPGDPIGASPYRVVDRLGAGGMGELFEVVHAELGRRAVLKVLQARHALRLDLAGRLRDEARLLARFTHPHLPVLYDAGSLGDGRPYFVMERLFGRDLRAELVRFGQLAVPSAVGLVAQALSALAAVHRAGVVHRDVKLENLFLCQDGRLKLLDFGIARPEEAAHLGRTGRGVALGTPRTMAPEQYGDEVDERADLYAAAIALFELVAGRGPFDDVARTREAMRLAHCRAEPPRLSSVAGQNVPPALDHVVARALHKDPERRFPSADALRRALLEAARPAMPDDDPTVVEASFC